MHYRRVVRPLSALMAAVGGALLSPGTAWAQSVSFSKDIVPILRDQCVRCHNTRAASGGLSVSTFAALQKGGKGGKSLAPKSADSRLVKYIEGSLQPKMPIGGSLSKAQIDKIKAWVDQGGKADVDANAVVIPDTAIPVVKVPVIKPKNPTLPEATALAWSKDGKVLLIGTYKVVLVVDPSTSKTIKQLEGHADKVHDLQFSPDGKMVAASGGPPSQQGEVKIWDTTTWTLVKTLTGHTDYAYTCSWSPDSKQLATASYDKTLKIWDVGAGTEVKTLKDHADAVYAVAFSPDGKLLASGSADRSVKVWEVGTGRRIYTLAGHTDTVYAIAWNPKGTQITSVGADKSARTWNVNAQAGQSARNSTAHEKAVNDVAYSPDGNMMATVSDDRSMKIWNTSNGNALQTIKDLPDGLLSVAFSPDNKQVAVGSFDGSVRLYTAGDGKLAATVIDVPKAPAPAPAVPKPAPAKAAPAKSAGTTK